MSEKELEELRQYNLEYLEALDNENLYDEDYTSAVELKYAKKEIERLNNIIYDIKAMFDSDEHFEDGCYCEYIEQYIEELKEVKK